MAANPRQPNAHLQATPAGPPTVGRENEPLTADDARLTDTTITNENVVDSEQPPNISDEDLLEHKGRIVMFRDQTISDLALRRWIFPDISPSTHRYRWLHLNANKLQGKLQAHMWTNKPLVKKIMDIGIEYSGIGDDGLPTFRNEDAKTRMTAFTNAFRPDLVPLIFKPLNQAIDVKKALSQKAWLDMYLTIFVSVALSIWDTIDWTAWAKNPNKPSFDNEQVYANMRAVVENEHPVRPGYDEIPVVAEIRTAPAKK